LNNHLNRSLRFLAGVLALSSATFNASAVKNVAHAATSSTPWAYSGLIDGYYLYDGNFPQGKGTGYTTGEEYDERASTPTIALAELNISKAPPATGGLGFKTTLITGDTAQFNVGNSTQEARYEDVQQLYLTYTVKSGIGADIGKFYTPFGYEVVESNANYNYSRSYIFSLLLPVYNSGIRVYTPSYKGLVATGYIVKAVLNDYEGVYDLNKSYGFIGQLNYTAPSGKFDLVETYGGSHDGAEGSEIADLLSDTDITVTPDAVNTFGFNYTNLQEAAVGYSGSIAFNGFAGYYRRQITAPYAVAFRAEKIFDYGYPQPQSLDSLTLTLEDKTSKSLLTRLEFRHDDDSSPSFLTGGAHHYISTENTISLSGVYTFGS